MPLTHFVFNTEAPITLFDLTIFEEGITAVMAQLSQDEYDPCVVVGRNYFDVVTPFEMNDEYFGAMIGCLLEIEGMPEFFGEFTNEQPFIWDNTVEGYCIIEDMDYFGDDETPDNYYISMQYCYRQDIDVLFYDYNEIPPPVNECPLLDAVMAIGVHGRESYEAAVAVQHYISTLPYYSAICPIGSPQFIFHYVGVYYEITLDFSANPEYIGEARIAIERYSTQLVDGIYMLEGNYTVTAHCYIDTDVVDEVTALFQAVGSASGGGGGMGGGGGGGAQTALGPASVFDDVAICNVGQALLVMLQTGGVTTGFFDFGLPDGFNRRHFPNGNAVAVDIAALIAVENPTTVVLSHYHADHINMARQVPAALALEWHTPHTTMTPAATQLNARILAAGGQLFTYAVGVALPNFGALTAQRITIPGSNHPHHQGIAASVTLTNGHTVQLPGDCSYEAFAPPPCYHLQASHHGGVYYRGAHPPVPTTIPPRIVGGLVVYSYSMPNSHHHPSRVAEYTTAGWVTRQDTPMHSVPLRPGLANLGGIICG